MAEVNEPAVVWTKVMVWRALAKAVIDTKQFWLSPRDIKLPDRLTIDQFGAKYLDQPKGKLEGGMKLFMSDDMRKEWNALKISMDTEGHHCYRQFSFPRLVDGMPFEIPRRYVSLLI